MINNKKVVVVMPAYNCAGTLEKTFNDIPHEIVDHIILVDDCSYDDTVSVAKKLGIEYIIRHKRNLGYGGNQKTCYRKAIEIGADIVIMLHPDYQYTPQLCTSMASLISLKVFDSVIGSRILGTGALKGGMPLYKFIANRLLTALQNILIGYKLSEYHTGYRAFSREVIESLNLDSNSDNFVFDNQMLAQIIYAGYTIGEITCPTRYERDSSSISFLRSVRYGIGVILTSLEFRLCKLGFINSSIFRSLKK